MPVEKRLGGTPRKNVGGLHTDAEEAAAGRSVETPDNPKAAKAQARAANTINEPARQAGTEPGDPEEAVPAGRANAKREITEPEPGAPGQTLATEVEQRKMLKRLAESRRDRSHRKLDYERDAYQFSAVRAALMDIERTIDAYERSITRDPADATFVEDNLPPQQARDILERLRAALDGIDLGDDWEAPEAVAARVNPQDRYDRNTVE